MCTIINSLVVLQKYFALYFNYCSYAIMTIKNPGIIIFDWDNPVKYSAKSCCVTGQVDYCSITFFASYLTKKKKFFFPECWYH